MMIPSIEAVERLELDNKRLKEICESLCERIAICASKLGQKSERKLVLDPAGGDPRFKGILKELWEQHLSKSADYGTDEDPLDNIHSAADIGIEPWVYAFQCAREASRRVRNHLKGRKQLSGDKLSNALLDEASWAILSELERRQSSHVAANLKGDR